MKGTARLILVLIGLLLVAAGLYLLAEHFISRP